MIFLTSIKKYAVQFLKILLLFIGLLLFYFFAMILSGKISGSEKILINALQNYGAILLYSLPFMLILSTAIFFAFEMNFDKLYALKIIPIVAGLNALILLSFFFINLETDPLPENTSFEVAPALEEGRINNFNGYNIYVNDLNDFDLTEIDDGILFYNQSHFISSGKIGEESIHIYTDKYIGDSSIISRYKSYTIKRTEKFHKLESTGLFQLILTHYMNYIQKIKTKFTETFTGDSAVFSIIGIILVSMGFYFIIASSAFFFNEKDIIMLNVSALFIISLLGYFVFQYFLSLVAIIKFGLNHPLGKIVLPSFIIMVFSGLIGFGLLQLKDALNKNKAGA